MSSTKAGSGWKNAVSQFFSRFLVHFVCFFAALLVDFGGTGADDFSLCGFFGCYVGLLCLVPKGDWGEPEEYLPLGVGLLQGVLLLCLGMPWQYIPLFAGLQAWIQKLVQRRGSLGVAWGVLPFFCAGLAGFFSASVFMRPPLFPFSMLPSFLFGCPLCSFIVVGALGILLSELWLAKKADALHQRRLGMAFARLSRALGSKVLADDMQESLSKLLSSAKACAGEDGSKGESVFSKEEVASWASRICDLSQNLESFIAGRQGTSFFKRPKWMQPQDETEAALLEEIRSLSDIFEKKVLEERKKKAAAGTDQAAKDEQQILAFEIQAKELDSKASKLPAELATLIRSIAASTVEILANMRSDSQDMRPGAKFLSRYLPASIHMVDEYVRLADKVESQPIEKSLEVLTRLDKAFKDELAALLQNDVVNFNAELGAIDSMLKMRGH